MLFIVVPPCIQCYHTLVLCVSCWAPASIQCLSWEAIVGTLCLMYAWLLNLERDLALGFCSGLLVQPIGIHGACFGKRACLLHNEWMLLPSLPFKLLHRELIYRQKPLASFQFQLPIYFRVFKTILSKQYYNDGRLSS